MTEGETTKRRVVTSKRKIMCTNTETCLKTPGKTHESDWREIRKRIERKIAAGTSQAISSMSDTNGASKHTLNGSHSSEELCLFAQKREDDKIMFRAANPRTGVISPSNRTNSSHDESGSRGPCGQKWRTKGNGWVSVTVETPCKGKSSKTAQSRYSPESTSSLINSIPGGVACEWEDQFVVNMPSARDPNPPTMTTQQIESRQRDMAQRETQSQSPSETSKATCRRKPYHNLGSPPKQEMSIQNKTKIPKHDKTPTTSTVNNEVMELRGLHPPISPPEGSKEYFSPAEVGKDRVSPIEEDSIEKLREQYNALTKGSFLGCKEMVGLYKNPDEILLFPNLDKGDIPHSITPPSPLLEVSPGKSQSLPQVVLGSRKENGLIGVGAKLPSPGAQAQRTASEHQRRDKNIIPQRTVTVPPSLRTPPEPPSPSPRRRENQVQTQSSQSDWKEAMHVIEDVSKPSPSLLPNVAAQGAQQISSFCPYHSKSSVTERSDCKNRVPISYYNVQTDSSREQLPQKPTDNAAYTPEDISRISGAQVRNLLSPTEAHAESCSRSSRAKVPRVAELDGFQVSCQSDNGEPVPNRPLRNPENPMQERTAHGRPSTRRAGEGNTPSKRERRQSQKQTVEKVATDPSGKVKISETKTNLKPLLETRKQSDGLLETREAYLKALERSRQESSVADKTTAENLVANKLATKRLAEAKEAYRRAYAKRIKEGAGIRKAAKESMPPKPSIDTTPNYSVPNGIGNQKLASQEQDPYSLALSLALDLSVLCFGQIHDLFRRSGALPFSIVLSNTIFYMCGHCLEVTKRILSAFTTYRTTGSSAGCKKEDLVSFMRDTGTAVAYLIALGFAVMMLGKVTATFVYVANWIVWLCRPFTWVYGSIGYVLFESK